MHQYDRPRRALAIALAGLAGYIDAAGFLSADRYFVSFMSGNTTRLGVDLIQFPALAWIPALLIVGFLAGVIGGAVLAAAAGERRKPVVLGTVALLLAGAAAVQAGGQTAAMLGLLVVAMGALNNTFQRDGAVSVGLTYMTGALVRMGQGLAARVMGKGGEGWSGWGLLWLGLALGAVLGAVGWIHAPALVLWIAAGWAGMLAALSRRLRG